MDSIVSAILSPLLYAGTTALTDTMRPYKREVTVSGHGSPQARLRLLHVSESYPPDYGGGAGIAIHDVCHALAERGHEVNVLCTEAREAEPYSVRDDQDGGIRIKRVNLPYFNREDPDGWELGLRRWRAHER